MYQVQWEEFGWQSLLNVSLFFLLVYDWLMQFAIKFIDVFMDLLIFYLTDFNIQEDIACCHEALQQQDIQKVSQTSLRMLGRARRVAMVTKKEMNMTADPMYKGNLQSACGQLESGVWIKQLSQLRPNQPLSKMDLRETPIWNRGCLSYLLWDKRVVFVLLRLLSPKRSTVGTFEVPWRVLTRKKLWQEIVLF